MRHRIGPPSIRRDVPHTSVSNQSTDATHRTVLERFPAGAPRGSWPAEEFAAARRAEGIPAEVVQHLPSDMFLVIVKGGDA